MAFLVDRVNKNISEMKFGDKLDDLFTTIETLVKLTGKNHKINGEYYFYFKTKDEKRAIEELGDDALINFAFENVSIMGPVFYWHIILDSFEFIDVYITINDQSLIIYPSYIRVDNYTKKIHNEDELIEELTNIMNRI